jgi:hypothetical protein
MITLYKYYQEDEEPLEEDELPEHLRPPPKIDYSKVILHNIANFARSTNGFF